MQILEGERQRLRARAGKQPGDDRGELPAPHLLRRQLLTRAFGKRNVEQRGDERRMLYRVQLDLRERRVQIGEALFGRDVGAAKPLPAPFGEGMQRRVLQQLRG